MHLQLVPQCRPHAGQELLHAERLGHVVVGTEIKCLHFGCFITAAGEHDDRQILAPRANLAQQLFNIVDNAYAPRGSNPHATGFVFDLDFAIYRNGREIQLGANTAYNRDALKSAAGTWLNKYATLFNFDSYDTGAEIWHLEYRKP